VLSDLGQGIEGGLKLAKEVTSRSWHSRTPFVFFTRKGNLLDAITAYEHSEALSVIKKPDPGMILMKQVAVRPMIER
jgi:hypothetical protein